jgi:hypothetical protein
MELGCDGVLMNTAIAGARDPIRMARAMKLAVGQVAKPSWPAASRASSPPAILADGGPRGLTMGRLSSHAALRAGLPADPSGGAGMQADIPAITALGCHPLSVLRR